MRDSIGFRATDSEAKIINKFLAGRKVSPVLRKVLHEQLIVNAEKFIRSYGSREKNELFSDLDVSKHMELQEEESQTVFYNISLESNLKDLVKMASATSNYGRSKFIRNCILLYIFELDSEKS